MTFGWKVESWSRERGRGTIHAEQIGSLPFDAAIADVDDFVVGEIVLVELDAIPGSFRVKRVTPDIPRFREPASGILVPGVPGEVALEATRLLVELPPRDVDRVAALSADGLVLEGVVDTSYEQTVRYRLLLPGPRYLELPLRWETKLVRLSTNEERAYLAKRFDRDGDPFLALTWITVERRFHFAVGASLEAAPVVA